MPSFDLGKVLSATAIDVRGSFVRLFPLFLTIAVTINLLNGALLESSIQGGQEVSAVFGPLAFLICFSVFGFAVEVLVAAQMTNGGSLSLGVAVMQALRRFPVLLLVILSYYIAMTIGILLLVIPGIIVFVTLGYAWFFVLLDGCGPLDALRESFRLVWGNAWQVAGANLLIVISYLIILGSVFYLLPGSFEELITLLGSGPAYADWRRWVFDVLGSVFGIVYLFLNLHIFLELKSLRKGSVDTDAPATVNA